MNKKVPMLKGWRLSDEEKKDYIKNKKLGMVYAGTSNICDLHCLYCQTAGGKPLEGEMTLEERKSVLDQAKELGCKLVHLAGAGEPTIDPFFWNQIEHINSHNMMPTIFTHGTHITPEFAQRLQNNNCSVIIKVHSFDEQKQDYFAGVKGYSKKRDAALKNLFEAGFAESRPTRIGVDVVISKKNIEEVPEIFRWARQHNVFPEIKPIISMKRGASDFTKNEFDLTPDETKDIYYKLLDIDEKEFGYTWKPSPPWVSYHCDYYYYHLLITIQGNIKPCIGFETILGNVRTHTLKECWEHPFMDKIRNIKKELKGVCGDCPEDCYGCPCRRIARRGEASLFKTKDCFADNM